jgi:hypothetical protein
MFSKRELIALFGNDQSNPKTLLRDLIASNILINSISHDKDVCQEYRSIPIGRVI